MFLVLFKTICYQFSIEHIACKGLPRNQYFLPVQNASLLYPTLRDIFKFGKSPSRMRPKSVFENSSTVFHLLVRFLFLSFFSDREALGKREASSGEGERGSRLSLAASRGDPFRIP